MSEQPSAELLAAVSRNRKPADQDRLDVIRSWAAVARDFENEILDLEQRLEELKKRRVAILQELLPDLMDEAGVPAIELEASGNLPAVRVAIKPFIGAGIGAKWPEEKKQEAYRWLDANGAGDLIKTELTVPFQRERRSEALRWSKHLREFGLAVDVEERVNPQTLSAWLRELVKDGAALPPLDLIGGFVKRICKIEEIK